MRPDTLKLIKDIRGTVIGFALQDWLDEQKKELNNALTIEGTVEEKGRIVEARQQAIKILDKLFLILEKEKQPNAKTSYKYL